MSRGFPHSVALLSPLFLIILTVTEYSYARKSHLSESFVFLSSLPVEDKGTVHIPQWHKEINEMTMWIRSSECTGKGRKLTLSCLSEELKFSLLIWLYWSTVWGSFGFPPPLGHALAVCCPSDPHSFYTLCSLQILTWQRWIPTRETGWEKKISGSF